jgi:hypothetical protein
MATGMPSDSSSPFTSKPSGMLVVLKARTIELGGDGTSGWDMTISVR